MIRVIKKRKEKIEEVKYQSNLDKFQKIIYEKLKECFRIILGKS